MPRLSETERFAALAHLPNWSITDGMLERAFTFGDFVAAVAFVGRVADLAEAAGHHPDLDIRYNRVRVALTTHDEGGITERDTTLAAQIDGVTMG